jgi:hypothetical protein
VASEAEVEGIHQQSNRRDHWRVAEVRMGWGLRVQRDSGSSRGRAGSRQELEDQEVTQCQEVDSRT